MPQDKHPGPPPVPEGDEKNPPLSPNIPRPPLGRTSAPATATTTAVQEVKKGIIVSSGEKIKEMRLGFQKPDNPSGGQGSAEGAKKE